MKNRSMAAMLMLSAATSSLARDGGFGFWNARVINAMPFVDTGSNEQYDNSFDYNCPGSAGEFDGKDQWYVIVATTAMTLRITTCSPITDYDTKLYVFRDSIDHASVVACNDDFCTGGLGLPYVAEIESVSLEPGHSYFIVVDAYSESDEGTFRLTVETTGVVTPLCSGDADMSGTVNIDDLNLVLSAWQMTVPPDTGPDLTGDGVVNIDDLNEVLSNWQSACG